MKNLISFFSHWFDGSESRSKFNTLVLAFILSFSTGVSADDTELFFSSENQPANVLFVLDTSISMANRSCTRDSTEVTSLPFDPNCDDRTRIEKLQAALALLIDNLDGVNAGIMQYNSNIELVVPVGSVDDIQKDELLLATNALVPKGGTGTQAALWAGRAYMRGQLASPTGIFPSPIVHECQQNHIILMSDGQPTDHLNNVAEVEADLQITCDPVSIKDPGDGTCGAEIGQHLFDADHSDVVDGTNNITTHTIGFNFREPWLASISGNTEEPNGDFSGGFGRHFDVNSSTQILSAFETIIESVGASFASPAVSVNSFNESRHRGELYYSQFQSSRSVRWNGNIKKYRLDEVTDAATGITRTEIVDANDLPLIDDAGQIVPTSQSLWADGSDGGSIPEGGFADELPPYTERNLYTDFNSTVPVRVEVDAGGNIPDLDTILPAASLGAADDAERDTLVKWVLGRNVEVFDPLTAAAATANSDAAAAAAQAAATAAADAEVLADAAAVAATDAQTIRDDAALAAAAASAAADAAVAANAANAAALVAASDAAAVDFAAADAAATAATQAADAALATSIAAAQAAADAAADASLSFEAALGANEQNNRYVADSLHNSPIVASYRTINQSDTFEEILFSSNNLGLLHAIDPDTGEELWSYIPEEHLDNIKAYFENAESEDHVYGLDGPFTLHTIPGQQNGYDFFADNVWLYMTERRGGNRVYALDVSNGLNDPDSSDPFSVMWKITGGVSGPLEFDKDGDGRNDFADLAQTWSKPLMVGVSINCPDNCETKDYLMFAGGYNPDIYDDVNLDYDAFTVPADSHGNAIYLVDPQTGELVWSVGNGAQHSLNLPMNHSVPSTPVPVDIDLDGSIDLMFFVDVAGDVWRVDFSDEANSTNDLHEAGGKIAELSPAGQSLRFFNPLDVVVSGTNFSTAFYSLVTGSGMRARPLFIEPNPNRLYTIIDRFVHDAPTRIDNNGDEVIDYRYVTDEFDNRSVITADDDILRNVIDPNSTTSVFYGFFRTFELGEKILQPTLVTNNLIFANSYVPPSNLNNGSCNFDIGETRLYIKSLLDGENAVPGSFGGDFITIGEGLLSGGQIIDTGNGDAPFVLIDKNVFTLNELTLSNSDEVFRRFRRTGWVELDEF